MINIIEIARSLFIPAIVLIVLNGCVAITLKKLFGQCLPITMMSVVYLLYFSQILFSTFYYAFAIIVLFCVGTAGYLALKRVNVPRELIATTGLTEFIMIYGFFSVLNFNKWVLISDEFCHWGLMVKEMVRLDRFYCVPWSHMIFHAEYPPFLSLFEYFWVMLCGRYSEMGIQVALNVFLVSILAVPFHEKQMNISKRDVIRSVFKIFAIILIIEIFDVDDMFSTVYKDLALPIIFAYAFTLLITRSALKNAFGYIAFLMASGAVVLTKELGIAFLLILIMAYSVYSIILLRDGYPISKAILRIMGVIVIPVLFRYTWNQYVSMNNVPRGQFSLTKIDPAAYLDVLRMGGSNSRKTAFLSFIKALIKNTITDGITLTYVTAFFFFAVILLLIVKKYRDIVDIRFVNGSALVFICGTGGFAFTMSVLYLFCFSEKEMLGLASFGRYMSSYLLAEALTIFFFFLTLWISEDNFDKYKVNVALILTGFFLLTFAPSTTFWIPQSVRMGPFATVNNDLSFKNNEYANDIAAKTEENTRILLVSSDRSDMSGEYIRYILNDRIIGSDYIESEMTEEGIDMEQQVNDNIGSYDYVYVLHTDNGLNQALSDLLSHKDVKERTVYKVDNNHGGYSLSSR